MTTTQYNQTPDAVHYEATESHPILRGVRYASTALGMGAVGVAMAIESNLLATAGITGVGIALGTRVAEAYLDRRQPAQTVETQEVT